MAAYEALLAFSAEMVQAARDQDWERLVALERQCRRLVDRLKAADGLELPGGAARARKAEIIRKVLAYDAEIRKITEPWIARLQSLLEGGLREKRLRQAYGLGDSGAQSG
jgi:flagellar protein FliT